MIGLEGLRAVCCEASLKNIPVVAIGGIGAGNAGEAMDVGADGVAVSALFGAADVEEAARTLLGVVDEALLRRFRQSI